MMPQNMNLEWMDRLGGSGDYAGLVLIGQENPGLINSPGSLLPDNIVILLILLILTHLHPIF
jgi:hypothetical protein